MKKAAPGSEDRDAAFFKAAIANDQPAIPLAADIA